MMNLKDRIRSFPILDYKLPFNEIFRNETKQDYRTYKQQQQYSKPRQTDISEFFKLIVMITSIIILSACSLLKLQHTRSAGSGTRTVIHQM